MFFLRSESWSYLFHHLSDHRFISAISCYNKLNRNIDNRLHIFTVKLFFNLEQRVWNILNVYSLSLSTFFWHLKNIKILYSTYHFMYHLTFMIPHLWFLLGYSKWPCAGIHPLCADSAPSQAYTRQTPHFQL